LAPPIRAHKETSRNQYLDGQDNQFETLQNDAQFFAVHLLPDIEPAWVVHPGVIRIESTEKPVFSTSSPLFPPSILQ